MSPRVLANSDFESEASCGSPRHSSDGAHDLGTTISTPAQAVRERALQVSKTLDIAPARRSKSLEGEESSSRRAARRILRLKDFSKDMRLLTLGIFENGQGGIAVDCKLFSAKGYF